ncbi:MAG: hypothetical protein J6Q53_08385 [Oscillospiraceae bacterium]|nr:hypothetical protein [Oscillospiraceae bacterium]
MGYTVHYGTATPKRFKKTRLRIRIPAAVLLLFVSVTAIRSIWPGEMELLRHTLLPWTQESAQAAFSELVEDLSAGGSFADAVTAFCQELLNETTDPG